MGRNFSTDVLFIYILYILLNFSKYFFSNAIFDAEYFELLNSKYVISTLSNTELICMQMI